MITQKAQSYAKVLAAMNLKDEEISAAVQCLHACGELQDALENPTIKLREKYKVIEGVFDPRVAGFIKLLCEHQALDLLEDIKEAYEALIFEQRGLVRAKLFYTMRPSEGQLEEIKKMLKEKYNKKGVVLELAEDASLIGGFVLFVNGTEIDKSIKGALLELQKALIGR